MDVDYAYGYLGRFTPGNLAIKEWRAPSGREFADPTGWPSITATASGSSKRASTRTGS